MLRGIKSKKQLINICNSITNNLEFLFVNVDPNALNFGGKIT